ncbi:MAG TPA: hypothetical protein VNJ08_02230 [Bacteriovoracaceae bacterium]|nr:hypothetical protein [Bacteriovoracaceae bacterium]
MKNVILLCPLFCFLLVTSCNKKEAGSVELTTADIYKPLLFQLNDQKASNEVIDLGEHVLTDDPKTLTIKVYNDTGYPYTDIELVMTAADDELSSITYVANENGEIKFPGFEGTCGKKLAPKASCLMKLSFSPKSGRIYEEFIELKFKNYVEAESHKTTVKVLAGMPASVVFTNDVTQYVFGQLAGTANVPVIERADALIYTKDLEVINAGGLSARNISVIMSQTCVSTDTNLCPTNMGNVYAHTHNCPASLAPGAKCNLSVTYGPKNQDPAIGPVPEDIKEIKYNSTLTLAYGKDPSGGMGGLNGYFRSISTNIEARFKVSISTLTFETAVVSGNRDMRTFKINNLGYREGEIKAIAFRDVSGALLATCGPKAGTLLLECRAPDNSLLTLEQFPFTVKDRNDCIRSVADGPFFVSVGAGCVFDFIFQPSVAYLTDKPTEFKDWQPEVIYDSRWLGAERIITKKLFNLSAESIAAARLVLTRVNYETTDATTFGEWGPWVTDLGRLTLQSPTYFKRKNMSMTFKNIGSVTATGIALRDGSATSIPIGGAGAALGPHGPKKYYDPATASLTSCTFIDAGSSCTINIQFAPIGLATNQMQEENMFDYIHPNSQTDPIAKATNYKSFFVTYNTGALFTDTNLLNPTDYPALTIESRLKATLVEKGMLMQMSDDSNNKSSFGASTNVAGDTIRSTFYITNMGTGTVPYMRVLNPPSEIWNPASGRSYNKKIIATPDFAAKGADYDCTTLFDIDYTGTISQTEIAENRVGLFQGLPKDKKCVFSVEFHFSDRERAKNVVTCNATIPLNIEEGQRFFTREVEASSPIDLWEYCGPPANFGIEWGGILISYYDGDTSSPGRLSPMYGNRFNLDAWSFRSESRSHGKLIPYSFLPWLSATMWRPQINLSGLATGLPEHTATSTPEHWFYGSLAAFYSLENDPLVTNGLLKGASSRNFVPTLSTAWANRVNYDYVYYVGSFPQNSPAIAIPLAIKNFGGYATRVTSMLPNLSTPPADASFSITAFPSSVPFFVFPGGDMQTTIPLTPLSFAFNPSVAGEHTMELILNYEDGSHNQTILYDKSTNPINVPANNSFTLKILVVAHVMATGTFPQLTMDITDYDVVQNDGVPPTVTAMGPVAAALTSNFTAPTSSVIFDTIKLTATPTPNDVYAKKTVTFKNETAFPLYDLKVMFRADAALETAKTIPPSFTTLGGGESTCVSGMTLPAATSCKLTFKYQPIAGDSTDTIILTPIYRTAAAGQYMMQNTSISLLPRSPGFLIAYDSPTMPVTKPIDILPIAGNPSQITRDSYEITIGTQRLDVVPKTWVFDQPTGGFKRFQIINTQSSKTSMLLSYHKYLVANTLRGYNSGNQPPTSIIPQASEYRTLDGNQYVPIIEKKYPDSTTRLLVEASKGCLFGDDENNAAIPAHLKGLAYSASPLTAPNPCYLIVTFKANFEYLQDIIQSNDGDDMRNLATEIWYYSVNRSSTASFWTHLVGTINPDISILSGNYTTVKALDTRRITFEVPKFDPTNFPLGSVVGTRVLMSTSAGALNDPYSSTLTSYVDINTYDPVNPQTVTFATGLTNAKFYYFRAVAIRRDNRFTYNTCPGTNCRFAGLASGLYLSAGTNTIVKVLVPPSNHVYFHDQQLVVDKYLTPGVAYDTYPVAAAKCVNRLKAALSDSSTVFKTYKLISKAAYDLLLVTAGSTSYANFTETTHWLSEPVVSIDTKCGAMPGFVPGTESQMLDSSKAFYLRNSSNPNANVNTAAGGVPAAPVSNYMSYVDGAVAYGSSRCMFTLP